MIELLEHLIKENDKEEFEDLFQPVSDEEANKRLESMNLDQLRNKASTVLSNIDARTLYHTHAWIPFRVPLWVIAKHDIIEFCDERILKKIIRHPNAVESIIREEVT
jgi:hypothetical protein